MEKYTDRTEKFIKSNVLPKLEYDSITEDNISEIVDFILDNYEVPLAQAKEAGEIIDDDLLNTAAAVVTEITSRADW